MKGMKGHEGKKKKKGGINFADPAILPVFAMKAWFGRNTDGSGINEKCGRCRPRQAGKHRERFPARGPGGRNEVPTPLVMYYTLGLLDPNSLAKASLRVKRLGPCRLATAEW